MSLVKNKNTKPELRVRKALHHLGYRYRVHAKDLPGCPDIVIKKYSLVVFVHGCFWHRHPGCKKTRTPKSNVDFWIKKFTQNIARDELVQSYYAQLGWKCIIIWECETEEALSLKKSIQRIISNINLGTSENIPKKVQ